MFTAVHYRAIAERLADHDVEPANAPREEYEFVRGMAQMRFRLAEELADLFEGDNDAFDRQRFFEAAHVPLGER